MNKIEHKKRHQELHKNLDELFADYISNNNFSSIDTPIKNLIEWSYKQTINPDHKE